MTPSEGTQLIGHSNVHAREAGSPRSLERQVDALETSSSSTDDFS